MAQVPSNVLPEYVSQYKVPATVVAFGAALASASEGVHDRAVALVSDAMVVCARLPNFALNVCLNDDDAG